jgi:FKBP-type peptidyl-prolyl cis-trans isomerase (trigger factor)
METQLGTEEITNLASDICNNLQNLNLSKAQLKKLNKLSVDLADIYEICVNCKLLIEKIKGKELWASNEKLAEILVEIQSNLYVHLPNHYKSLSKALQILLDEVDNDEYATQRLERTLKKANRMISP